MSHTTARIHLRHPILGAFIRRISLPVMRGLGVISRFPGPNSSYARERRESLRRKLATGETAYLLGLTPGGHNTGAALVQVSQERGIELLSNHEEERFRSQKHCTEYPAESIAVIQRQMRELGIGIAEIHAVLSGWDYSMWVAMALECVAGELPGSLRLLRKDASPYMNAACVVQAFRSPTELQKAFRLDRRLPVINLRHHANHAYFSYAVSPFGGCDEPVMILVVDGAGDDGAITLYIGQNGRLEQLYQNHSPWDSLGLMYGVLSSTKSGARLHLWVPPIPNDEGIAAGAAYHFAGLAGAPMGKAGTTLQHAFYCGLAPTKDEIERAIHAGDDIAFECLGNINSDSERLRVAEFLAHIVSEDGVMGLFQGIAETGPRALGHRSILANPANRETLKTLNSLVKFREIIRPLAPMATLHAAQQFFELCPGASDDNFNAYNYMVLTARAKPQAFAVIPAVIHHDGTCRVQIVRESIDRFCYEYLRAMGRRIGAEVSVNTSLNVGAPIAQTPEQALETMKRSKGMHGMLMIASDGTAYLVWHNVAIPPKDAGHRLRSWASVHGMG